MVQMFKVVKYNKQNQQYNCLSNYKNYPPKGKQSSFSAGSFVLYFYKQGKMYFFPFRDPLLGANP